MISKIYDQGNLSLLKMSLPKIIHQIWIGDHPIPETWIENIRTTAIKLGFEYRLWRDKDIANFKLSSQDIYDCQKIDRKTEVAKYEILQNIGGIYIDADNICVNISSFVRLLQTVDRSRATAFIGFESPSDMVYEFELLSNRVIGTVPHSSFIEECYLELRHRSSLDRESEIGSKLTTKIIETLGRYTQKYDSEFVAYTTKIKKEKVLLLYDHVFYSGRSPINITFAEATILYQLPSSRPKIPPIYYVDVHHYDRFPCLKESISFDLMRLDTVDEIDLVLRRLKSHLRVLDILEKNSYWMITVIEDNFKPIPNFNKQWSTIERELQGNHEWEIAILAPGHDRLCLTGDIVEPHLISGTGPSLAMVCYSQLFIQRRLKEILKMLTTDVIPLDVWILNNLRHSGQSLLPFETLGSYSDDNDSNEVKRINDKLFSLWSIPLFMSDR